MRRRKEILRFLIKALLAVSLFVKLIGNSGNCVVCVSLCGEGWTMDME